MNNFRLIGLVTILVVLVLIAGAQPSAYSQGRGRGHGGNQAGKPERVNQSGDGQRVYAPGAKHRGRGNADRNATATSNDEVTNNPPGGRPVDPGNFIGGPKRDRDRPQANSGNTTTQTERNRLPQDQKARNRDGAGGDNNGVRDGGHGIGRGKGQGKGQGWFRRDLKRRNSEYRSGKKAVGTPTSGPRGMKRKPVEKRTGIVTKRPH
ncbi:MAG: hypothetical protein ABI857_14030 [Acidobacteriota bacterium]